MTSRDDLLQRPGRITPHADDLRLPISELDDAVADLQLAPPRGEGRTLANWRVLARTSAARLDTGRLTEAHLDAATILHELDGPDVPAGSRWGVWAAEDRRAGMVRAEGPSSGSPDDRPWTLTGAKLWCSGATTCTHALITAAADDGPRLFAVDLTDSRVRVRSGDWRGVGMARSAAATVELGDVDGIPVGGPRAYLDRAGFWHGALAVAAAWFGGAVAVAAPARRAGLAGRLDPHGSAHLGAIDAALVAARALLVDAADAVDTPASRHEPLDAARRRALRVRAAVESAADAAIRRTGRATGPGPLAHDAAHAQRVADLEVYLRQSHAEADLAALGALVGDDDTIL